MGLAPRIWRGEEGLYCAEYIYVMAQTTPLRTTEGEEECVDKAKVKPRLARMHNREQNMSIER